MYSGSPDYDLSGIGGVMAVILIVEDDPIIAMMLEDAIRGLGLEPIGPISSVAGALELLVERGSDHSDEIASPNAGELRPAHNPSVDPMPLAALASTSQSGASSPSRRCSSWTKFTIARPKI